MRLQSRCWPRLQSSEGLTHMTWQEAAVSYHMGFSIGLLECPQNMVVAGLLQSDLREGEMEVTVSFMT